MSYFWVGDLSYGCRCPASTGKVSWDAWRAQPALRGQVGGHSPPYVDRLRAQPALRGQRFLVLCSRGGAAKSVHDCVAEADFVARVTVNRVEAVFIQTPHGGKQMMRHFPHVAYAAEYFYC